MQSSSIGASLTFKKRHQSIDQVMKAKGAKKLLVDESVYSYQKSLKKGSTSIDMSSAR